MFELLINDNEKKTKSLVKKEFILWEDVYNETKNFYWVWDYKLGGWNFKENV